MRVWIDPLTYIEMDHHEMTGSAHADQHEVHPTLDSVTSERRKVEERTRRRELYDFLFLTIYKKKPTMNLLPSYRLTLSVFLALAGMQDRLWSQTRAGVNYDEEVANHLSIPDVLTTTEGVKVADRKGWLELRKPELMRLYADEVYGRTPTGNVAVRVETTEPDLPIHDGLGFMRQTTLAYGKNGELKTSILLFLPTASRSEAVPMFVLLNFWGNHAITNDARIPLSPGWFRENKDKGVVEHRATEASRGCDVAAYPIREILKRGYGVATAYYGDFDPDFDDGFKNGVHALFPQADGRKRTGSDWGSISAWAWGLSRMADHLQTLSVVDGKRLAVLGHSRLGKAALWAGAQDERFGIVISNNSGEGGAALAKRNFGETTASMTKAFPHWFAENFKRYAGAPEKLPMDQHALIGLIAPRPVYIASATEDMWADPKGEFLSGLLAERVYSLFEKNGLGVKEQPEPDTPVGETIGYHLRTGKHSLEQYDWERYLDFADRHWR